VRQEYGQRQPNSPGAILTLVPGQRLRDLVFKLIPAAVIAGRVYDEDGEPVPGARMEAMQYQYIESRRQLTPMRYATTNDLGEYRLFGLPPGRYYIRANYSPGMTYMGFGYMSEGAGRTTEEEGYAPTYYPGTNDGSRATAMEVRQGDEIGGVDILLLPTRTVRIRGRVFNAITGKPARDASVYLFPRGSGVRFFSMDNRSDVKPPDGAFEIVRATPGSYTLSADWYDEDSEQRYSARLPLEVGSANIEGLELTLGAGMELSGRVEVEAPQRPSPAAGEAGPPASEAREAQAALDLDDLFVQLNTEDDFPFGGESAPVKEDGSFQVKNLSPGEYKVEVWQRGGLPGDYYLKSARLAGNDVLEEGLTVSGPVRGSLELVLSPAGGHIEGTVLTAEGKAFSGARVVLVPEERRRKRTDLFKNTTTDQYGRFTLRGLTPGEYKLFAWEDVEPGAYQDSEFLRPYEEKGKEVRIREGDRPEVELALIPAEGVRRD